MSAALLKLMLIDAAVLRNRVVDLGSRDALARVAHLLCEIMARLRAVGLGKDFRLPMPFTQADLAFRLRNNPRTCQSYIQALRHSGLLQWHSRIISISDWTGLCASGCNWTSALLMSAPATAGSSPESGDTTHGHGVNGIQPPLLADPVGIRGLVDRHHNQPGQAHQQTADAVHRQDHPLAPAPRPAAPPDGLPPVVSTRHRERGRARVSTQAAGITTAAMMMIWKRTPAIWPRPMNSKLGTSGEAQVTEFPQLTVDQQVGRFRARPGRARAWR